GFRTQFLHFGCCRLPRRITEAEIVATAQATRQDHPEPPDGPKALDRAMQRAAQRKVDDAGRKHRKVKPGTSARAATPSADVPAFYAAWVNSDSHLPTCAISSSMRNTMLSRGLVTPDRMRERGVL
ncbi:helix-turn-helix domain-containing protein, partial [Ruegeria pomeroyi]|nr:helix-turn-helix domain-containing protein [Ruegeria pomeroyi]